LKSLKEQLELDREDLEEEVESLQKRLNVSGDQNGNSLMLKVRYNVCICTHSCHETYCHFQKGYETSQALPCTGHLFLLLLIQSQQNSKLHG